MLIRLCMKVSRAKGAGRLGLSFQSGCRVGDVPHYVPQHVSRHILMRPSRTFIGVLLGALVNFGALGSSPAASAPTNAGAASSAFSVAPVRKSGETRTSSDILAVTAVKARLDALVPVYLRSHFDLYLFVSKARLGGAAQHMFIFKRDAAQGFAFSQMWLVSTGRERSEQYFTTTPAGLFKLDPQRFFTLTHSQRWRGAAMPHAMFFDYRYRTRASGLAIHAASRSAVPDLGSRASGGCVRLHPDNARTLFETIKTKYAGKVPEFVFDEANGTTNRQGKLVRNEKGQIFLADGYRVLLVVDDFAGSQVTASSD